MKIGELLRHIADAIDAEDNQSEVAIADIPGNGPDLDAQAGEYGDSPDEVYVGPLQQKHELLKKATGVENNVDQFADDDELAKMQANAGIQQAPTVININTGAPPAAPTMQNPQVISQMADDFSDSD